MQTAVFISSQWCYQFS